MLRRAEPLGTQLLTMTGHPVPATDLNRLLAIEELVERQLFEVLPSARVVDRVVQDGLFRFCIDAGEEALGDVVVDYCAGGASATS